MNRSTLYFNLLIEYIKLNTLSAPMFDKFSDKNLRKLTVSDLEIIAINLNKNFPNEKKLTAIESINKTLTKTTESQNISEIEKFLNLLNIKFQIN